MLLESALILPLGFIRPRQEILSLWRVIGKRPGADRAARGLEREAIIFLVESLLSNFQLILGSRPRPLAAADGFIRPAFTGPVNQRSWNPEREHEKAG